MPWPSHAVAIIPKHLLTTVPSRGDVVQLVLEFNPQRPDHEPHLTRIVQPCQTLMTNEALTPEWLPRVGGKGPLT
jgi:hypothetical protein